MMPKSAKQKARRFQDRIRAKIAVAYDCHADDVKTAIMGERGLDIKLSPQMAFRFPYGCECKAQESISIWASWDQAVKNARLAGLTPALFFTKNNREELVVITADEFIALARYRGADR